MVFKILKEILSNLESNPEINYSATEGLIVLLNIVLLGKKYIYISELLNVIYLEKTENLDEELQIRATATLHKITNHITQEYKKRKNPNVIKWFNGCFKELPNIAKTRVFLKEICKAILKSGAINQLESQFILNCVKNYHFTFTVTINKDNKEIAGEIIFDDRRYEIFKNDNLEEFATMLLAATDDPLAEQYKTHKPLFPNNGIGLKIAASDIMDVNSITNEEAKLSTKTPLLSYIRDIEDNSVMLLEKRNVFGEHLIYKFNNNFEKVAAIYPNKIHKATIKQIFKELESEKFIQCFVKSSEYFNFNEWQLVNEEGRDFFQDIMEIIQNEKVELETSNFKLLGTEVNIRLNAHENILKDGGIINKAEINREVERLKQNNPLLYNYWSTFHWSITRIIAACCIAETEFFENNISSKNDMIKLFIKPFKSIPVIGAIIDTLEVVIYGWLEAKQNIQHKNNIIIINDIFHRKVGIKDLDDILKKIAITITQARKDEIINPKAIPNHNSLTQKLQNCVRAAGDIIYDKAKNILLPEIIEGCDKDNTAVQLALKDVEVKI